MNIIFFYTAMKNLLMTQEQLKNVEIDVSSPVVAIIGQTNEESILEKRRDYLLTYYLCLQLYNIERSEKSCVTKKDGSLRKRFWAIHTFTVEI
jgi:hypothetical protein